MTGSNLVKGLAVAGALLVLHGATAAAQVISAADAQRLLTPADVAQAGGLQGVHRVAQYSVAQALGDLNFALGPDTVIVLTVQFGPKAPAWMNYQKSYTDRRAIAGIGEAAFVPVNPPALPQGGQLIFLKGSRVVALVSGWVSGKPRFSEAQLTALARIIASRL